jgi:hypothetical protein
MERASLLGKMEELTKEHTRTIKRMDMESSLGKRFFNLAGLMVPPKKGNGPMENWSKRNKLV